ncbi:MAG: hypothetical protein GWN99_12565 [Gemmatimonadetes bacterium]|uniref:PpiC domain-containing protein n=1 Tax=Candidatus Kutchimonas denitrificans TaxID=3056748 RepID=A0AAE4Z844_9BACT|nr:hypothetical protein [Gemmatimonadota bacterium]NIR75564.1 hypothetical protein [Candidatus Kutchimonas denitrificans]NIS01878.1 hypothetical protein [Gemmatimonadota bacterium]NIT67659.1 hypothetical protein [Gemmatimonadota bacterium]NIU53533.1 hypothetical protein [Gemmatimonadota bacterium]
MKHQLLSRILVLSLAAFLVACSSVREGMEGHGDAVAIANGYELTIDHLAELLAPVSESIAPANTWIIDRTVDLWVSYTVLASEYAREDEFARLDIAPLARFNTQRTLAGLLQADLLRARAIPNDSVLRAMYEREQPYVRVRARHLVIWVPDDASEAEVDSLRRRAEDIRQRLVAGESFSELAQRYSADPLSGRRGGDLGWKTRGQLVEPLDSIAFNLEPGTISDLVRTNFGFHILEVTQRRNPEFHLVRPEFEKDLIDRRAEEIEAGFADSLMAAANVEISPGSIQLLRRIAFSPRLNRLGSADRQAILVRYDGGELTMGEWIDFVVRSGPDAQAIFASPDTTSARELLRQLARNEIIARAARTSGYEFSDRQADSVAVLARGDLRVAAQDAGYRATIMLQDAPEIPAAVDQAFNMLFLGRRGTRTLDRASPALRRNGPAILIHPYRYPLVVERLRELRAAAGPPGTENRGSENGS